tara:strand:- start:210 stop:422 length:213 start_codon:yes stop_codon:yes gene_type:complete
MHNLYPTENSFANDFFQGNHANTYIELNNSSIYFRKPFRKSNKIRGNFFRFSEPFAAAVKLYRLNKKNGI